MAKEVKGTPKLDAQRRAREEQWKAREAAADKPPRPIDNRINEASTQDPNGRGGKTKIKVPTRETKVKPNRDRFPVPGAQAPKRPAEPDVEADTVGRCSVCGRTRALIGGVLVGHSSGAARCSGSGKGPRVKVAK